jgi:hypothetical protein
MIFQHLAYIICIMPTAWSCMTSLPLAVAQLASDLPLVPAVWYVDNNTLCMLWICFLGVASTTFCHWWLKLNVLAFVFFNHCVQLLPSLPHCCMLWLVFSHCCWLWPSFLLVTSSGFTSLLSYALAFIDCVCLWVAYWCMLCVCSSHVWIPSCLYIKLCCMLWL